MNIRILISILIIISCNTQTNNKQVTEPSRRIQIQLVDSLGQVTLSVPARYDTVFSWVNHSDCGKPCDEQEYRCQPKSLPITKETGFYWLGEPKDSIDRFTMSHSGDIRSRADDTAPDSLRYRHFKAQIITDPENPAIIYDTMEKIDDRYFSIFVMKRSGTIDNIRVLAATTIKGNEVKFRYDLLWKKGDTLEKDFIDNSLGLIHTIRINKNL